MKQSKIIDTFWTYHYLCEGDDHVPAKCPMDFIVDAVNDAHEKIAQDAIHAPRKTSTRVSRPCQYLKRRKGRNHKEPTPPLETYHRLCLRSGRTLLRKKTLRGAPHPTEFQSGTSSHGDF